MPCLRDFPAKERLEPAASGSLAGIALRRAWRTAPRYLPIPLHAASASKVTPFRQRGTCKEFPLPKRNYGFEKRQKEIARKNKQEDKRKRRLDRSQEPADETPPDAPAADEAPPSD
jgi:hypothetical protein